MTGAFFLGYHHGSRWCHRHSYLRDDKPMVKTTLLSITCLALNACATGGPNPNTPLRTIGPNVQKAGVFTGKEGAITGTLNPSGSKQQSTTATTSAPASADKPTGSINVNEAEYAEFQAWKNARQQDEFEEWKRAREQQEFQEWKRAKEAQQ